MRRTWNHHEPGPDGDLYRQLGTDPMSREHELELFARRATAGPEERERIDDQVIRSHIGWASVEAGRVASGAPFTLLRAAAVRGLHLAIERYEVARGVRFLSYARWWIKHSLQDELREQQEQPVTLPTTVGRTRRALADARAAAPDATIEQLLDDIDCHGDERAALLISLASHVSLDEPTPRTDHERPYLDSLAAPEPPEEDGWCDHLPDPVSAIQEALEVLPARTRTVLSDWFGLDGQQPRTYCQIAESLRVSRQRVHQIRTKGLEQLRQVMIAGHDQLRQAVEAAGAVESTSSAASARPEEN